MGQQRQFMQLTLVCGYPAAGKTTYARRRANHYTVIHTDDYIEEYGYADALTYLLEWVAVNIKSVKKPIMLEGILAARVARKIEQLELPYTYEVIWVDSTPEMRKHVYENERIFKSFKRAESTGRGHEKILNEAISLAEERGRKIIWKTV